MGICDNESRNTGIINYGNEKKNTLGERINEIDTENTLNIIDINIYNSIKSVCKIITNIGVGTGFLIKLYKNNKEFFCLMTNQHVLKEELINLNQKIIIYFDAQNERREIILNKDERFIKDYTNINLDLIILEIIKKDNINERYFLLPYLENLNEFNFINQNIFIVQFPKGNLGVSKGKILKMNNYEITHNVSTQLGSSGSPIFLENTTRVIGIHKGGESSKEINYSDLIYPIVKEFELNNKITYETGEYYIG